MKRRLIAVLMSTAVLFGAGLAGAAQARPARGIQVKCAAETVAVVRAQALAALALGEGAKAHAHAQLKAAVTAHAACMARA